MFSCLLALCISSFCILLDYFFFGVFLFSLFNKKSMVYCENFPHLVFCLLYFGTYRYL